MKERLHKYIAQTGYCSRRKAEILIAEGKVKVNGHLITTPGSTLESNKDHVSVEGKILKKQTSIRFIKFNKPRGYLVTKSDPDARKTIYDILPQKYHDLKPVGRLDFDSQGLLLLTNNGDVALKLSHPRYGTKKIYRVKMFPIPGPRQIKRISNGLKIDNYLTKPIELKHLKDNDTSSWYEWTLHEGRNRQIRKLCERVNLQVKAIIRIQYGPFKLDGLGVGRSQAIEPKTIQRALDKIALSD